MTKAELLKHMEDMHGESVGLSSRPMARVTRLHSDLHTGLQESNEDYVEHTHKKENDR